MVRFLALPMAAALLSLGVATPAAAAPNIASQFSARMLAAHNAVRAQAGASPLAWDATLGQAAALYAAQLALTNRFQHSDRRARRGTGGRIVDGDARLLQLEAMVRGWAAERGDFVPGVFPAVSRSGNWARVGHYTQMVWPTTTRVGCAVASNASNDYLVCRYSPAGNIDGRPVPNGDQIDGPGSIRRASASITPVSGWCLSSQRLMIRKLRRVGAEEEVGDGADKWNQAQQEVEPTMPAIRAMCHLGMSRLRASQTIQAPSAAAIMSPTTGTTSRMTSRPNGRLCPGKTNSRSSNCSIASTRWRTDCGSRAEPRKRSLMVGRNRHYRSLPAFCSRPVSV